MHHELANNLPFLITMPGALMMDGVSQIFIFEGHSPLSPEQGFVNLSATKSQT